MKADVWTNIAYGAAGLAIAFNAEHIFHYYVALTFALLMFGSAAFHGKWHPDGQAMDECAMYLAFSAISASHYGGNEIMVFFLVSFGWIAAYLWQYVDSFIVMPMLAFMALGTIAVMHSASIASILFLGFIAAVYIRHIGEKKQSKALHGVWHVITAVLMYLTVFPEILQV